MQLIHFDIPVQKVHIREEFLFDLKEGKNRVRDAELISISSYPGHTPTFTALVEKKFLFHYLPINAFTTNAYVDALPFMDCHPFNCPSGQLTVSKLNGLDNCEVFSKKKESLGHGRYLMTFDWYQDNELCHLVELKTGNLVLAPSHKIIFNSTGKDLLPAFKKLHSTWRIV